MRDTPITVLLVEDNPGDARLLQVNLTEEAGDAFRIEWVQDLSQALERISTDLIDAVVLDLNLPDSSGFDTFAQMRAAAADVPVLVLTGLEDDALGLKAIQQGAQDYLAKADLTGSAVARALRYAVERHRSQIQQLRKVRAARRGKVIGFIGAKGGVGTTTVLLNVAAVLAKNRDRTVTAAELRADCGSFAAHLHESPRHTVANLLKLDFPTITESVLDKCIVKSSFGFDVLFSPQRPHEFRPIAPEDVRGLIDRLAYRSAYTLIDLPSHYGPVTEAALRSCHVAALVTERDPSALAAARAALSFFGKWESRAPALGLIVVNRTLMIDATSPKQIEEFLACDLLGVVPPAPDVCVSAQRSGTPVVLHRPLSSPASMLSTIAESIVRLSETAKEAAPAPEHAVA